MMTEVDKRRAVIGTYRNTVRNLRAKQSRRYDHIRTLERECREMSETIRHLERAIEGLGGAVYAARGIPKTKEG